MRRLESKPCHVLAACTGQEAPCGGLGFRACTVPGAAPIVGHGENPRARWVGGLVHSSCHCYRESKAQRVGHLLQEAPPDSTSELESRASALCWSCLRLSPAPRPPCPGLLWGPDLLASSARVRSRSGRASSQSRMVSLSCPLRRGRVAISVETATSRARARGSLTCRPAAHAPWPRCRADPWP